MAYGGSLWQDCEAAYLASLDTLPLVATDQADGLDGTLLNGASRSDSSGLAYSFDGVDDFIGSIGTLSTFSFVENTLVFGVSCWIKLGSENGRYSFIGNSLSASSGNKGWSLIFENGVSVGTRAIRLFVSRGGGMVIDCRTQDNAINDTDWHHIAVTCSAAGNNVAIYVDGVATTLSYQVGYIGLGTGDSARTLTVGRANSSSIAIPLAGMLDDIRIYSRHLSASDVTKLASQRGAAYTSNTAAIRRRILATQRALS